MKAAGAGLRVGIYARYSTEHQDSIDAQVRKCKEYAKQQGWMVSPEHIYKDPAITGTITKRPGYQSLLTTIEQQPKPFDVLIVSDSSRSWRDTEETSRVLKRLRHYGIGLIGVTDGVNTLTNPSDVVPEIMGALSKEHRRQIGVWTHLKLEDMAQKGLAVGGPPYGYRVDPTSRKPVMRKSQANMVRRMFALYAGGMSHTKIAHLFNAKRIPGPRGGTWSASAIYEMVRNTAYIGQWVWNRSKKVRDPNTEKRVSQPRPKSEWKVIPTPRIIPDALWEKARAQEALMKRSIPPTYKGKRPAYLLTGLLHCPCGARYTVWDRGRHGERRMGCASFLNRGQAVCRNGHRIPMEVLERIIVQTVEEDILSKGHLDQVIARIKSHVKDQHRQANRATLEAQLREIEPTLAWAQKQPTLPDPIQLHVHDLEQKRDRLLKELATATDGAANGAGAKQVQELLERALNPTVLNLRNLMTGKREPVVIRDTRATIRLLYRDVDAGRAALRAIVEKVTITPSEAGFEIEIEGTTKNILDQGLLTADGIIPIGKPPSDADSVLCGIRGAGRGI